MSARSFFQQHGISATLVDLASAWRSWAQRLCACFWLWQASTKGPSCRISCTAVSETIYIRTHLVALCFGLHLPSLLVLISLKRSRCRSLWLKMEGRRLVAGVWSPATKTQSCQRHASHTHEIALLITSAYPRPFQSSRLDLSFTATCPLYHMPCHSLAHAKISELGPASRAGLSRKSWRSAPVNAPSLPLFLPLEVCSPRYHTAWIVNGILIVPASETKRTLPPRWCKRCM